MVGVGLGVSNGDQAREVTEFADAVIVGSALVKTLLEAEDAGRPRRPRPAARGGRRPGRRRTRRPGLTGDGNFRPSAGLVPVVTPLAVRLLVAVGLLPGRSGCTGAARRRWPGRRRRPGRLPGRHLAARPVRDAGPDPDRHRGPAVQPASSPSKPVTLLFFGYTHCPDVCIAVLADVAIALQRTATRPTATRSRWSSSPPTRPATRPAPIRATWTGSTRLHRADRHAGHDQEVGRARSGWTSGGRRSCPSGGYEVGHSAQVIGFDRDVRRGRCGPRALDRRPQARLRAAGGPVPVSADGWASTRTRRGGAGLGLHRGPARRSAAS